MFNDIKKITLSLKETFTTHKALVIGDTMLDRHLWGEVNRISPEAPVPVFHLTHSSETAGGAGNVALNLAGLGLETSIVGLIGQDQHGNNLKNILKKYTVHTKNLVSSPCKPTITKTRIISGHQQLLRIDEEELSPVHSNEIKNIVSLIRDELNKKPAVIVLSDYFKGVLTSKVCKYVISQAQQRNIPILIDPKGSNYIKYSKATTITPNYHELTIACSVKEKGLDALLASGKQLLKKLKLSFIVLTRGEEGITLIERDKVSHVPAIAQNVFDVSGAGDTVIATLAACLSANINILDSIHLANLAAGIVVSKIGTVPITKGDLLKAIHIEGSLEQCGKVCKLDELKNRIRDWKVKNKIIVFTNGCFDLLHAGHVTYLEKAKKMGTHLVIGLNSDNSVKKLKGEQRPVIQEMDRAKMLAALSSVDAVVIFNDETPLKLVLELKPDILVKGEDYTEEQVVGANEVKSWGGKVVLLSLLEGRSTTNIVERMNRTS